MGKSQPDAMKAPRQRQLSIIYFVDAARTRTITISLVRLRLVLAGLAAFAAWSLGSIFLTASLVREQGLLTSRLKEALASIFEYETRDDHVFDIAYPPLAKGGEALVQQDPAVVPAPSPSAVKLAAKALPKATGESGPTLPAPPSAAPTAEAFPGAAAGGAPDGAKEGGVVQVAVGRPRIEHVAGGLEMLLDLTNKSASSRVEGFIYAVAEYTTDQGQSLNLASPAELQVNTVGEAVNPHKAALFGIRRFKEKRFSFTAPAGTKGRFSKVHVVLLGRIGQGQTSYNFPVPAATPAQPPEQSRTVPVAAPKSG